MNENIDSYFNFLTELAFRFVDSEKEVMPQAELMKFYGEYSDKFLCDTYDAIISTLKRSKIIQGENEGYRFCYKYILYYLSAKKISDVLHSKKGQEITSKLFQGLHEERNANILVFVTHHSKDISFIESSLISMMEVLENKAPITLEKTDPFYSNLSSFIQDLKNDIMEHRNPKDEREKELEKADKRVSNGVSEDRDFDNNELSESMLPFLRAFRSIEIVGQILRNRKGSLEIPRMKEMLSELYTTGFRTIAYYGELLDSVKKDIMDMIEEKSDITDNKFEIEERISDFIQATSFRMLLSVFIKLMNAAGDKELKKLYIEVAGSLGTPAAKVVSFSINSYHGVIDTRELSSLVDELKGNIVALKLLRARVASYVYNRAVDYATKQKLASILNMTLLPKPAAPRQS